MIAAGMAILSQQDLWARRRLARVRNRALPAAATSVRSWPTLALSLLAALSGITAGVVWGLRPGVPGWWPLSERWWLPGGWGTGTSMIGSGCIAVALIGYSYWRFRIRGDQPPHPARTRPRRTVRLPAPVPGSSRSTDKEIA